jgi:hypothetical protein
MTGDLVKHGRSTFYVARPIPVIVAWFAGRTWKNKWCASGALPIVNVFSVAVFTACVVRMCRGAACEFRKFPLDPVSINISEIQKSVGI